MYVLQILAYMLQIQTKGLDAFRAEYVVSLPRVPHPNRGRHTSKANKLVLTCINVLGNMLLTLSTLNCRVA